MSVIVRIAFAGLLLVWVPAWADNRFTTTADVYAVGDVHGAYDELVQLLKGNGLLDEQLRWSGGEAYLVSIGDLIDRGPGSRQVMDLFRRLPAEAEAVGGRVIVTLGNHEVMNLLAEFRDVSAPEVAAFGTLTEYAAAMRSSGEYGKWMATLPLLVTVNDTVFVHGGLTPASAGKDLNQSVTQAITTLQTYGEAGIAAGLIIDGQSYVDVALADPEAPGEVVNAANSMVLGDTGPLWYRGNAACHPMLEAPGVNDVLAKLGAKRMVVGHTPTPSREVVARFGGRVYAIDTGMLKQTYKGQSRLLRIRGGLVVALNENGQTVPFDTAQKSLEPVSAARKLNGKQRRAMAAYRMDQLLELNMVEPLEPEQDLTVFGPGVLTEASRVERGWRRPAYCAPRSDFDLVSVFDSLIGKLDRSGADLGYDPNSWQIRLTNHVASFASSTKMPVYAAPPKLPALLAAKLEQLERLQLERVFDGLLSKRQIRALLQRRDKILTWPVVD